MTAGSSLRAVCGKQVIAARIAAMHSVDLMTVSFADCFFPGQRKLSRFKGANAAPISVT
jgi:hypothetical protein